MKKAGQLALNGDLSKVDGQLNSLGLSAQNAVRAKISDGPFVPIKEVTKRARLERRASYKRASEKQKAKMMAAYLAGDFSPLIDTGQMRRSVTYVLAKKGK